MIRRWVHRVAHWTGWNGGHVETTIERDGRIWVGFKCAGCDAPVADWHWTGRRVKR